MSDLNKPLVNRINDLLSENKITLNHLAKKCNLRQSTLSGIVNYGKNPNLTTIYAIAKGFDMSVTDFLNFEPYNKKTTSKEVVRSVGHSIY